MRADLLAARSATSLQSGSKGKSVTKKSARPVARNCPPVAVIAAAETMSAHRPAAKHRPNAHGPQNSQQTTVRAGISPTRAALQSGCCLTCHGFCCSFTRLSLGSALVVSPNCAAPGRTRTQTAPPAFLPWSPWPAKKRHSPAARSASLQARSSLPAGPSV